MSDFAKLTVAELRKLLGDKGLDTKGVKADLVDRLTKAGSAPTTSTADGESKKETKEKETKDEKEEEEDDEEEEEAPKKGKKRAAKQSTTASKKQKKEEKEKEGDTQEADEEEEETPKKAAKPKKPSASASWKPKAPPAKPAKDVPYGPIAGKLKIVSWNVNGLNAALTKGGKDYVKKEQPDIICFQEVKVDEEKSKSFLSALGSEYTAHFNCCTSQKNYAGTAIYTKQKPISVTKGLGVAEFDDEGRVITAEFDNFYLVNSYVPNSGMKLERLEFRQKWDKAMLEHLNKLKAKKGVIWTGDLNVAHEEIDLAMPDSRKNKVPGFCDEERADFTNVLKAGYVDTWRERNPGVQAQYTFWSYKFQSKEKNLGWRLDYWVVSKEFYDKIGDDFVRPDVNGSDHVPLGILV